MLSNPYYSYQFEYIGAFVNEREKLIEDGFEEEKRQDAEGKKIEMSRRSKHIRWEQSDLVMILLNLSYIPDDVVKHIDFQPGWQRRFQGAMEGYKAVFQQQMKRKWKYQCRELEDEYSEHIRNLNKNGQGNSSSKVTMDTFSGLDDPSYE